MSISDTIFFCPTCLFSRHCETSGPSITFEGHNHFTLQKDSDYIGAKGEVSLWNSRANFTPGRCEWGAALCQRWTYQYLEELVSFGGGGYSDTDFGTVTSLPLCRHHFQILQPSDLFILTGQRLGIYKHLALIADQSPAVFLLGHLLLMSASASADC